MTDKKTEALKLALEALSPWAGEDANHTEQYAAYHALRERLEQPEKCQCPACKIAPHASDCPVHNEPAWPNGPCDCGAQPEQEPVARSSAYDMIDRFLQNNLNSDEDYAEYSKALDSLYTSPPAQQQEPVAWLCRRKTGGPLFAYTEEQLNELGYGNISVPPFDKVAPLYTKEKNHD